MTPAALLVLALRLHPAYARALPPAAPDYADAIAAVTDDRDESVELLTLAHVECGLRVVPSCVPFGATAWARRHHGRHTLAEYAAAALATIRVSTTQCGPSVAQRMGFYRTGTCRVDREAERRGRIVRRLHAREAP
jgi:hypothetical protein